MALSNIALCVFTMPLTLLDLLHHYWPLASGQEVIIIAFYCRSDRYIFSMSDFAFFDDYLAFDGMADFSKHFVFSLPTL